MEAMKLYRDVTSLWTRLRPKARELPARLARLRPQVGELPALWSRVRQPAVRMLVGGGLMIPAAVLMAGHRVETRPESVTIPRVLEAEAVTPSDMPLIAPSAHWTEAEVAPPVAAREDAPDWSDVLERGADAVEAGLAAPKAAVASVASFAREFKIPLQLASQIHAAAVAEKIKPRTAFGLVKAESSFRTQVVSPVGAVGLTQLLPSTARWLVPGTTRGDLMKPETNLRVGFKYLRHLIEEYDGNEKLALTAYNRGPGTVQKLLRRGRDPDNGYADKVLTGSSQRHVRLMNAKFGSRRGRG
jgi:soluble lytic murein transglycosylase-like protein